MVKFLQDLAGWIPKREVAPSGFGEFSLQELYYVGQVINCRVRKKYVQNHRVFLTLNVGSVERRDAAAIAKDVCRKSAAVTPVTRIALGSIVRCRPMQRQHDGILMSLLSEDEDVDVGVGFVDVHHLRENVQDSRALLGQLGGAIEITKSPATSERATDLAAWPAVVIGWRPAGQVQLSLKRSYLEMARAKTLLRRWQDVQVGIITYGTVRDMRSYGIMIEFCWGVRGLLLKKRLLGAAARQKFDVSTLHVGQTLPVRIVEVEREKRRLLLELDYQRQAILTEAPLATAENAKANDKDECTTKKEPDDAHEMTTKRRGRSRKVRADSSTTTDAHLVARKRLASPVAEPETIPDVGPPLGKKARVGNAEQKASIPISSKSSERERSKSTALSDTNFSWFGDGADLQECVKSLTACEKEANRLLATELVARPDASKTSNAERRRAFHDQERDAFQVCLNRLLLPARSCNVLY